jgi:hypothetical protein
LPLRISLKVIFNEEVPEPEPKNAVKTAEAADAVAATTVSFDLVDSAAEDEDDVAAEEEKTDEPEEEVVEPEKGENVIKPKTTPGVVKGSSAQVGTFFNGW